MRLVSFLTISLTLSQIRGMVLKEEQLIAELLLAREALSRYKKSDSQNVN